MKKNNPTKADIKLAEEMRNMITKLNHRLGIQMCKELNANCFDCKTRILIAYLNEWISVLTY